PFEQLLPAHRSADADPDFPDAQKFPERLIGPDHIPWSEKRKIVIVGFSRFRIYGKGSDAAIAATRHIHADNEIFRWIDQVSAAYQAGPPVFRFAVGRSWVKYP